jgi:hypothetical protein
MNVMSSIADGTGTICASWRFMNLKADSYVNSNAWIAAARN